MSHLPGPFADLLALLRGLLVAVGVGAILTPWREVLRRHGAVRADAAAPPRAIARLGRAGRRAARR